MASSFHVFVGQRMQERRSAWTPLEGHRFGDWKGLRVQQCAANTGARDISHHTQKWPKQEIVFEYMADMNNYENIHRLVNKFLAVSDIEKVAKLLEIPVDELHKLPFGIREKICGHYALEYDENGDNSGLTQTLKGLIFS